MKNMPRCAFLSTDHLEDFFVYDDMVKPFLLAHGWSVDDLCWRNNDIDYNDYDVVVVRSTWDYQSAPDAFLTCLKRIDESSATLENSLPLMHWNLSKAYLRDLENAGVAILPTLWHDAFDKHQIDAAFEHFNCPVLIIKPLVSANADHTYKFTLQELPKLFPLFENTFASRPFMIQAFEASILEKGEYSLFYFGSVFSHAICKRPALGDFRVQEEHGGQLEAIAPTNDMLVLAEKTIKALPEPSLYARVDMLETTNGLAIIEIELIEPSLYFNMDEGSAKRFADTIAMKFTT
jgi:glutathione synthase/RimK-type ligase-like ATP-grasp enzyme